MSYLFSIGFCLAVFLIVKVLGNIWSGIDAIRRSKEQGKLHIILSKGWITLYKEIRELEDNINYFSVNKLAKKDSKCKETLSVWTEYHFALEYLTMLEILQNEFEQDGYTSVEITMQDEHTRQIKIIDFDEYVDKVCDQKDYLYDSALEQESVMKDLGEEWRNLIGDYFDED